MCQPMAFPLALFATSTGWPVRNLLFKRLRHHDPSGLLQTRPPELLDLGLLDLGLLEALALDESVSGNAIIPLAASSVKLLVPLGIFWTLTQNPG
jgi:hypothetical protein